MYLKIQNIKKEYVPNRGIWDINLDIQKNEFITLLGPSGCGKTTLLNVIGGFLEADTGEIHLDNTRIDNLPTEKRPVSTVFQNYALFAHYSVLNNVAYGLRFFRKMNKKTARQEAVKYLEQVGLDDYAESSVTELSGGQQQRVALARGLATSPKLLLLDEPLSNLDANLRIQMRQELKKIQREFDVTIIFVTHDQEEALSMSDRIVVMKQGTIEQIGTPAEIYHKPTSEYVANFVGQSNWIDDQGTRYLVRPENITIVPGDTHEIIASQFLGIYTEWLLKDRTSGNQIKVVTLDNIEQNITVGSTVGITYSKKHKI